jgi:hypothetical protein
MGFRILLVGSLLLWVGVLSGCKLPGSNSMEMNLPGFESGHNFYANGFPTDLRVDNQGKVDLSDFPRQSHSLTRKYVETIDRLSNHYHTVMPVYLPFTNDIDVDSLSSWDLDYASPESPIQLIDVDPASKEYGRRFPLSISITRMVDKYRPRHLLQVLPSMGVPLRPNTTYALIVTDATPPVRYSLLATG